MKRLAGFISLVILGLALVGGGNATGRGAGYRSDYATGRSQPEVGTGEHQKNTFYVNRVVDGDTVRLNNGEKVRLIGVDTPETKHPTKPVQYFGKEASQFTQREIERRSVVLDYEANKRDKYGRLLAYVHRAPDQFFLNAELIKQGYGFAYTRFLFRYMEEFRAYERQAREEGRGLWQREKSERRPSPVPAIKENLIVENHTLEKIEPVKQEPVSTPPADVAKEPVAVPVLVAGKKKEVVADNCKIKGNINRTGEKIYHVPGGRWYEKTKIEEGEGERWFCTEEEAGQAGWRKAGG